MYWYKESAKLSFVVRLDNGRTQNTIEVILLDWGH